VTPEEGKTDFEEDYPPDVKRNIKLEKVGRY